MKFIRLFMMVIITMGSIAAHAESVQVINNGYGQNLDAAISKALRRSIEQVRGVSIASESIQSIKTMDSAAMTESQYENNTAQAQVMTSQGRVTYSILSENCDSQGCHVKLNVSVDVPDGMARRKVMENMNKYRRTMVVLPFSGPDGETMQRYLRDRFVQDRKMSVLDLSSQKSVDYVLRGRVLEAKTHKRVVDKSYSVALTGEKVKDVRTYYTSKVLVEYQMIDVATGQIKWSATVPTTSSRNNLDLLLNITADKIFSQLKNNIYPLVAIKIGPTEMALNSGGQSIKVGQIYDLFEKAGVLRDPYTKEVLGFNERKVAQGRVTRVLAKTAYIQVIHGDISAIKMDAIARLAKAAPKPKRHRASRPSHSKPKPATAEANGDIFF
ncbi:hypothetical protein VST7929_01020 [Vibrio stylophorae]|uniref:Curli production assembly/transport component CsgG n=1 Tax=Vibrio stylophorae TaxID=659351 RepID=A0ABN8DWM1_9VIBR|nr:hypothetical protein [Vibrio stylophorae]CAH0533159.1 hypothetical protein VST7929_01020 [Vibrio stylophorae]